MCRNAANDWFQAVVYKYIFPPEIFAASRFILIIYFLGESETKLYI